MVFNLGLCILNATFETDSRKYCLMSCRSTLRKYFVIGLALFLCQDLLSQDNALKNAYPHISSITVNGDSVIYSAGAVSASGRLPERNFILSSGLNNIIFEMKPAGVCEYRYFLRGFDKSPTKWRAYNQKEYTNLPSGRYSFTAWFRDASGAEGETDSVNLKIVPAWYVSKPALILYPALLLLAFWGIYRILKNRFDHKQFLLEQMINQRMKEMQENKDKTEKLLANVLPKETADEIMATGRAAKIKYNFVTVLFSDIQGFTQIAEEMNPEVLIDELDKFFFHFDSVVEKYRIEKIKTIGDAYMCAGGIPEKNRTNPVEVILAALEMQAYMKKLKEASAVKGMKYWDIRIGIHTGTVVAGVVGQKKLSYDIWGDTVNTASRMESSGEAGKINISGTTYEFVKDFFICEHRGKMPVKYKGELDMYFVHGIIPELSDENGMPNRKFITKMQIIRLQDVEEFINRLYSEEASPNLYFHDTAMLKSLSTQVDLLSRAENLPEEEYVILKAAAIFLYTGYAADYGRPLEEAALLIEETLPRYGFGAEEIDRAKKLISNSFNEKYETLPDMILHDARYDYLGRVDYIRLTDKLYREQAEYGIITDKLLWLDKQKKLLRENEFLTKTGRLLRSVGIEDQIAALYEYYSD